MVSKVISATNVGFDGQIIEVECDSSKGLPGLQIVGLPNKAIDEAKDRVRSAIKNSNLDFPAAKVTINLAPANLPKDGAQFDLPIALAILAVSGQLLPGELENSAFAGELSLDGKLRPIKGVIGLAETAKSNKIKRLFIPLKNAQQAQLIKGIEVIGINSLSELFLHLKGERVIQPTPPVKQTAKNPSTKADITIDDVHGQETAKRALLIAAAGHHNVLFTGPPGTGKSMLAKALLNLLPPLTEEEQIEITKLHSLANESITDIVTHRPFRSPHHTASHISLVGGGKNPLPGEISLAHLGVLFLDELPEYPRASLEVMRQPLEDRVINISRAGEKVTFPANFMLVATKNPCPCGYFGDTNQECKCSTTQILQYQRKISGPLLDRIDLIVHVGRIPHTELLKPIRSGGESAKASQVINKARIIQQKRYKGAKTTNATLTSKEIKQHIKLDADVVQLLEAASKKLGLTTRSYFKVIKVARTIADLEKQPNIQSEHVSEALQYRMNESLV